MQKGWKSLQLVLIDKRNIHLWHASNAKQNKIHRHVNATRSDVYFEQTESSIDLKKYR